jgi:hypothetical protein
MSLGVNDYVERIAAFQRQLTLHPERRAQIPPHLLVVLDRIGPAAVSLLATAPPPDSVHADIERRFDAAHALVERLHHGIRYVWCDHPEIIAQCGPLTVGATPEEDATRLATALQKVSEVQEPRFVWAAGLTLPLGRRVLSEHLEALAEKRALREDAQSLETQLRALRAPSHDLWHGGLGSWVLATFPNYQDQIAWGRPRRSQPRPAKQAGNGDSAPGTPLPPGVTHNPVPA